VTDRYTEAIEQLRSASLEVRIDGIKALERIVGDSPEYHPKVMEELTEFIRERSREPWPPAGSGAEPPEWATRRDVQEAFTVIGRRNTAHDIRRIDLTGAVLDHAYLEGAKLGGAKLTGAVLPRAKLTRAKLTRAVLTGADLDGADLRAAMLGGADLTGAKLTDAYLADVVLGRAVLDGAYLRDAVLTGAYLTDADSPAQS
jgi:Pentapeptide repeats (8 copies)